MQTIGQTLLALAVALRTTAPPSIQPPTQCEIKNDGTNPSFSTSLHEILDSALQTRFRAFPHPFVYLLLLLRPAPRHPTPVFHFLLTAFRFAFLPRCLLAFLHAFGLLDVWMFGRFPHTAPSRSRYFRPLACAPGSVSAFRSLVPQGVDGVVPLRSAEFAPRIPPSQLRYFAKHDPQSMWKSVQVFEALNGWHFQILNSIFAIRHSLFHAIAWLHDPRPRHRSD